MVSYCLMGLTNIQIAHELKIAPETVKHHLKNIFEKTGACRRSQLAALLPPGIPPKRGLTTAREPAG